MSPIAGARLIADRLVNSHLSCQQIVRLARSELGAAWPDGAATPLERLQVRLQDGDDRIDAIIECGEAMPWKGWHLVENDLLQREFAWPLIVGRDVDGDMVECSLPIRVDVVANLPAGAELIPSKGLIDCEGWRVPLHNAEAAAKDLWVYKHTSWDPAFARQIRRAKAILNLQIAEKIVAPYQDWIRFSLTDRSHEAYLASVIFSRFFGHKAVDTICATGAIGARKPDPAENSGGDFYIEAVQGIDQKIDYAERAFFFDQIIIPGRKREVTKSRPRLRVSTGALLSDYVEHIAGQVWHKHRWVRAPDMHLAYLKYRRRDGLEPLPDDEFHICEAEELLRDSEQAVLELPATISPQNAMAALYRVSDRAAEQGKNNRGLAHFTVVRVADGEGYDRFWQTVWEALEGDREEYGRVGLFARSSEVGELLAKQLNHFRPNPGLPRRAPDILVIIGHNRLPPQRGVPSGPEARLHLDRLRPWLDGHLSPSPIDNLRAEIGYTRVLLVQETPEPQYSHQEPPLVDDPAVAEALKRLSVFRHGFTWEMARRMVGLDDQRFPEVLRSLLVDQDDRGPLLLESTGAVEFFVNRPARLPAGSPLAELHFLAADAIVGFLRPDADLQGRRLDIALGLSARWRHEAQWHLACANRHEPKESKRRGDNARGRYRSAHERLNRIAQPLSYSRLRWAVERSSEESLDTWRTLEAKVQAEDLPIHPLDLLWIAKFADKLRNSNPERAGELSEARGRYFRQALGNCHLVPREEIDACRFLVASSSAAVLMRERPNLEGWKLAARLNQMAENCQANAVEIYDPDWFEFVGDGKGDYPKIDVWGPRGRVPSKVQQRDVAAGRAAAVAAPIYRSAFWNDALQGIGDGIRRIQYLVKWLGALEEAGVPLNADDRLRIQNLPETTRDWVTKAGNKPESGLYLLSSVQRRWLKGRAVLEGIWRE